MDSRIVRLLVQLSTWTRVEKNRENRLHLRSIQHLPEKAKSRERYYNCIPRAISVSQVCTPWWTGVACAAPSRWLLLKHTGRCRLFCANPRGNPKDCGGYGRREGEGEERRCTNISRVASNAVIRRHLQVKCQNQNESSTKCFTPSDVRGQSLLKKGHALRQYVEQALRRYPDTRTHDITKPTYYFFF